MDITGRKCLKDAQGRFGLRGLIPSSPIGLHHTVMLRRPFKSASNPPPLNPPVLASLSKEKLEALALELEGIWGKLLIKPRVPLLLALKYITPY